MGENQEVSKGAGEGAWHCGAESQQIAVDRSLMSGLKECKLQDEDWIEIGRLLGRAVGQVPSTFVYLYLNCFL